MASSETAVAQLVVDAKANDDRLDAKLREELNVVTSVLGDELRVENVKTQEAITNLKGIAVGAVTAARSMSNEIQSLQWAVPVVPQRFPIVPVSLVMCARLCLRLRQRLQHLCHWGTL